MGGLVRAGTQRPVAPRRLLGHLAATATLGVAVLVPLSGAAAAAPSPVLTAGPTGQTPDGSGGVQIAGLVTNTGTTAATDIDITLTEYSVSGAVLGVDPVPVTTDLIALAAGETGGYSADLSADDGSLLAGFDHFAVTAIAADPDPSVPDHDFTVAVVSDTANGDGSHSIVGTVRNDGAVEADAVQLDFVFLDASGHPVDTDFTYPDNAADVLAAGATDTFDEEYDGPAYSTVTAVAEGIPGSGGGSGGGGSAPPACDPCVPLSRVQGTDRDQTAVAESRGSFPAAHSARAVVLARSDSFPDALTGGPLAAHLRAPLLLTTGSGLDAATAAEIVRVAPKGSTVYLLGGPAALGPMVTASVLALGDNAVRVFGPDRYATAVAVAKLEGNPTTVFEATGLGFADALSAVPAAVTLHASILLTDGQRQAPATASYLATLPATTRYAIGYAASAADTTATSVAGPDRYATSTVVASLFFTAPTGIGFATGTDFPDALGAGPVLGARSAPLILLPGANPLPDQLIDYLAGVGGSVTSAVVFGGTSAVSAPVTSAAQNALALGGLG